MGSARVIAPKRLDGYGLNELLSPAATLAKELEQQHALFVLAFNRLTTRFSSVRDQITGSPVVPTLNSAGSSLLSVLAKPSSGDMPPTDVN